MRILIPVDGSDYTKRALGYVSAHDELFSDDHERVFLHVVPELPTLAARQLTQAAVDDFYQVESEAVFGPVRAFAQQRGWKFRLETAHGHAAAEIAASAEREKPDLIVMGSHGRGAIESVALGSVSAGVLARCWIPLLLIR